MLKVSAVTVTWNSRDAVGGCLESLIDDYGVGEIILVDNASTDGTPGLVRSAFPSVKIIENSENLGFAQAANAGIAASSGEYALLINPDITFKPGFVTPLAAALDSNPDAGSAAPMLLRPDGRTIDSAGLVMKKNRKAYDRGRDIPLGEGDWPPCRVFGASGAAALLRRSMLEDVKIFGEYFDESFHSYKEDVDLAWRANLFGWKSLFVPEAAAFHERGWKVSGRKSVPRSIRINSHRNRYLTIIKNEDPVNLLFHLPWVLPYEIGLILYSAIFEPFLFLAFRDIIRLVPETLRKRKDIMRRRKLAPSGVRCLFG